ncbi:hypothetical protein [Prevotella sp. HCN-7019]|uniref:hypothetical protein n=1 Tax=Prevotella sp. HCN-7019 TaxID=3134668 RepID=UPI0030BD0A2D
MKEKVISFITSKWFSLIVGLVLTILVMWQEKSLGDMINSWALGLITSLLFGCLAECFRLVIMKKFIWTNILYYLGGSIIGMIIMFAM